jgi:hypothetical protein
MKSMRALAVLAFVTAMTLGAASCKDSLAPSMLANMGGMDGVTKLMANWTGAMSANEALSKSLSADDMSMITRGFVNEVAKASEVPMPNAGVDLVEVLKGKNLPKESLTGVGDALKVATGTTQLSPEATKGAMGLWEGVVNKLQ